MPLPSLNFDDPTLGLPRQPVPIRYACMAADWSPGLLALLVSGFVEGCPPLLKVYQLDAGNRIGCVDPSTYAKFRNLTQRPLPEALEVLPANHFVWSDDLVCAHSRYVDLTIGRESAFESGVHVRWEPALGECAEAVAASADISSVRAPAPTHFIRDEQGVWTIAFEGRQHAWPEQKGFRYLRQLLLHPHQELTAQRLHLLVNPPPPEHVGNIALIDSISDEMLNEDGSIHERASVDDIDDFEIDEQGLRLAMKVIAQKGEEMEIAKENGDIARYESLQEEIDKIERRVSASTNQKGRPRLVAGSSEKMRKAISNAISRAIQAIDLKNQPLAAHLQQHIRMGHTLSYSPPASIRWSS